jgi:hypothetical protein
VLRGKDIDLRTGATSTRSAGPFQRRPRKKPAASVTAANHVQHRLAVFLFDNFERPLQRR